MNKKTVAEVMVTLQPRVEPKLKELFAKKNVDFPPKHVTLLYIKDQKKVFLYSGRNENEITFLKTYDVLAASGVSGPKLKEGDNQVPEGVYAIESLNPNSRFHLALRVNYPNHFDVLKSKQDGRSDLGGDIMIHGSNVSIGCLAMGDDAVEELFALAAITGYTKWKLIFSPTDFRVRTRTIDPHSPQWIAELDQILLREFLVLP
jgi:murein L,D-transpeptidase YafK